MLSQGLHLSLASVLLSHWSAFNENRGVSGHRPSALLPVAQSLTPVQEKGAEGGRAGKASFSDPVPGCLLPSLFYQILPAQSRDLFFSLNNSVIGLCLFYLSASTPLDADS